MKKDQEKVSLSQNPYGLFAQPHPEIAIKQEDEEKSSIDHKI